MESKSFTPETLAGRLPWSPSRLDYTWLRDCAKTLHCRALIEQALKIYQMRESVYLSELARTTFLRAQCYKGSDATKSTALLREAAVLRCQILETAPDEDTELKQGDFDQLVTFFSR